MRGALRSRRLLEHARHDRRRTSAECARHGRPSGPARERDGTLEPGDVLVAAIDAGAQLSLRGAGEHATVVATRLLW
eukprot:8984346-Lingulodinium_polyedra.AAC.1